MPVQMQGNSGNVAEVDNNLNQYHRRGIANYGSAGGAYIASGTSGSSVVAAALGANTTLMSLRHGTSATTNLYITRLRFCFANATVGASAGIPGQLAWQRFTAATPSGGSAHTPARKDLSTGAGTQVLDWRDSNAALTVTSVNFGDVLMAHTIPNGTTGLAIEYAIDLDEDEFIRLTAGDGVCLRTQVAAPATQTWVYSYALHYLEK